VLLLDDYTDYTLCNDDIFNTLAVFFENSGDLYYFFWEG